ncbi:MAG: hypothetical protein ABEH43_04580 [Flavobacteriales bacterium]
MTNQDRIEGAKLIVEFMPGWEIELSEEGYVHGLRTHDGKSSVIVVENLWKDRNLLHEVLTEIDERGLAWECSQELGERVDGDLHEITGWKLLTADPETIFDAIVACVEREVDCHTK